MESPPLKERPRLHQCSPFCLPRLTLSVSLLHYEALRLLNDRLAAPKSLGAHQGDGRYGGAMASHVLQIRCVRAQRTICCETRWGWVDGGDFQDTLMSFFTFQAKRTRHWASATFTHRATGDDVRHRIAYRAVDGQLTAQFTTWKCAGLVGTGRNPDFDAAHCFQSCAFASGFMKTKALHFAVCAARLRFGALFFSPACWQAFARNHGLNRSRPIKR